MRHQLLIQQRVQVDLPLRPIEGASVGLLRGHHCPELLLASSNHLVKLIGLVERRRRRRAALAAAALAVRLAYCAAATATLARRAAARGCAARSERGAGARLRSGRRRAADRHAPAARRAASEAVARLREANGAELGGVWPRAVPLAQLVLAVELRGAPGRAAEHELEVLGRSRTRADEPVGGGKPGARDAGSVERPSRVEEGRAEGAVPEGAVRRLAARARHAALLVRAHRPQHGVVLALLLLVVRLILAVGVGVEERAVRVEGEERARHRPADVHAVPAEVAQLLLPNPQAEQPGRVPEPDRRRLVDEPAVRTASAVLRDEDKGAAEGGGELHRVRRQ
mmetsp:Transcript_36343/g.120330  ORF Transcript_36343/g.120330 Transcript_36343/m.120330 type:complete len:340 (+) Transcript_36343:407-1426(+)